MVRLATRSSIVLLVFVCLLSAAYVVKDKPEPGAPGVTVAATGPTEIHKTAALTYTAAPDWLMKNGGPIGIATRSIAVSANGDVYVATRPGPGQETDDPKAGIRVYAPDGTYIRNVPNARRDLHQIFIRKEQDGEFLYGTTNTGTAGEIIVKMTLDGKVVLSISASAIPDQFKDTVRNKDKNGKLIVAMGGLTVAPNGDLYAADSYASDWVHHFDRTGKYLSSFGGKKAPYSFSNLHNLAIDTRFTPVRIIGADRDNSRVVHLSMDGKLLGVVAKDLWRPTSVGIYGDYAIVGEIKGRVTILDKTGQIVTTFGTNTVDAETGTPATPPAKWRPGVTTAPHGVAVNQHGDVFVAEWSDFGRVHRFNRQ